MENKKLVEQFRLGQFEYLHLCAERGVAGSAAFED